MDKCEHWSEDEYCHFRIADGDIRNYYLDACGGDALKCPTIIEAVEG